eukprot:5455606-Pyramimonas_sp.AAC.1
MNEWPIPFWYGRRRTAYAGRTPKYACKINSTGTKTSLLNSVLFIFGSRKQATRSPAPQNPRMQRDPPEPKEVKSSTAVVSGQDRTNPT